MPQARLTPTQGETRARDDGDASPSRASPKARLAPATPVANEPGSSNTAGMPGDVPSMAACLTSDEWDKLGDAYSVALV
eukprot:4476854-Alexandrium_andersonii.AAC.1